MAIYFFSADGSFYSCFSNFSLHGFELEGHWWLTSEHYYQAHKHIDTPQFEQVRQAPDPTEAKLRGRALPCRSDWEAVKDEVMHRAVLHKFLAHGAIRDRLLATGDEVLIEDSPVDYYWGCGADGSGRNRLGEILMEIRARLLAEARSCETPSQQ